ncbi:PKD domain-containing protein [bacterium]|nr:PKD domain-containing protein [bacterium]
MFLISSAMLIQACAAPAPQLSPTDASTSAAVATSNGAVTAAAGRQPHQARQVSAPPDLNSAAAVLSWNSASQDLSWYYTHPGDYNQDGLVTVSDITPLGVNFNAAGPFAIESALAVVDGNSDGMITVSDITPIGQNFNKSIERYQAFCSTDIDDYPAANTAANGAGATLLGTVQLVNNPLLAGQRRHFTLHLAAPPATGYAWVRPLSTEHDPGTPSSLISFGNPGGNALPTVSLGATPTSGDAPLTVNFTATATDSDGTIVQYAWDFDGDGSVDSAGTVATATHVYLASGSFSAGVTVLDNDGGSASASISISAFGGGGQPPTAQLTIIPENAAPGDTVVLHGAGSSDPEGTTLHYSFDPEGDGTFRPPDTDISLNWTYTELGTFHPALRVIDEDNQVDTAAGNLEISLGALEQHVLDQQVGDAPAGLNVDLLIADGKPAVVYYDSSAELDLTLRWCSAKDAAGSEWWDQKALGTCYQYFSAGLAGGFPCVAYNDGNDIHFLRATDAAGTGDWGTDRLIIDGSTVSDTGVLGLLSLSTINEKPTVVCNNLDALMAGDLVYIEATNSQGTGWPALGRQIANNFNYVAFISALAEVGGRPAIAFVGGFLGDQHIMYMRSYDATGISWTLTPLELTPSGSYVLSADCLDIVFGYPAVAWHNHGESRIEFARALDAEGSQWGEPLVISSVTNTQADIDLMVINNLPCIAYCDHATGLYVAVGADLYGNSWNEPVLANAGAGAGKSPKLAEIDGRVALAYYNRAEGRIEFAAYRGTE